MATSSSGLSKKLLLKCCDGEIMEVDEKVASQCLTLKHMMEDIGDSNDVIPIPNVTKDILAKIIEYCEKHALDKPPVFDVKGKGVANTVDHHNHNADDQLKLWDKEYLHIDQTTLYNLSLAANYLDVKNLLDLTLQRVADMIKGKKPEQIRAELNIKNDFKPEEEEAIREQYNWAFAD